MDPTEPPRRPELDANDRFMLSMFRRYYRAYRKPWMPDRFTKKEYGFIPFGGTMRRHMGFTNPDDLYLFLATKVPRHSYYSTAYYRRPSAATMEEKEWMGAELIFDLDADHLAGADRMTYSEMMVRIRGEMIALVDDYLLGDLGFSVDQVRICFSGGRGYHAHVRSDDILTLGTHERRELVDYITCAGLDMDWVFPIRRESAGVSKLGGDSYAKVREYRTIPSEEEGGWKRRMRNALKEVVSVMETENGPAVRRRYPSVKSSNETLDRLADALRRIDGDMFVRNSMSGLTAPQQEILISALKDAAPALSSEIDRPVTPDVKRLIRLPGSLHGKTGLRVTPITRRELTDYDPLQSAVPESYTDSPVKVTMRSDMSLDMLGERMSLKGETEVPEYAAAFLIGRKYADFGWKSRAERRLFRISGTSINRTAPMHPPCARIRG